MEQKRKQEIFSEFIKLNTCDKLVLTNHLDLYFNGYYIDTITDKMKLYTILTAFKYGAMYGYEKGCENG